MTVKDIKDLLAYCSDDMEVKIYTHNPDWTICNWYFNIKDAAVKDDGVYIELN